MGFIGIVDLVDAAQPQQLGQLKSIDAVAFARVLGNPRVGRGMADHHYILRSCQVVIHYLDNASMLMVMVEIRIVGVGMEQLRV
jgi:hypothetical protein